MVEEVLLRTLQPVYTRNSFSRCKFSFVMMRSPMVASDQNLLIPGPALPLVPLVLLMMMMVWTIIVERGRYHSTCRIYHSQDGVVLGEYNSTRDLTLVLLKNGKIYPTWRHSSYTGTMVYSGTQEVVSCGFSPHQKTHYTSLMADGV